jgi:hypothetical protein
MFTWTILGNKVVQKLKFSKNDIHKNPAPKLKFFNEKKFIPYLMLKIDFESQI